MFKHTEPEFLKIKVGDSKVAADIIVISSSARNSCPTAPCACLRHCQREPGVPAPAPACALPPAGAPCWSPHRWGGHAPGRRTSLPRIANSAVVYLSKSFFFFLPKKMQITTYRVEFRLGKKQVQMQGQRNLLYLGQGHSYA